jgi:hypothetical protein
MTEDHPIHRFYSAFAEKDSRTMKKYYSSDVVFSDPVFGVLHGEQVFAMWEMLTTKARDFSLSFEAPEDRGDGYWICKWVATYRFSGKKVTNRVKAFMKLEGNQIIEHSDAFSFHRWAAQAFGFPGWLLGWTGFYKNAVKKKARKQLELYMLNR